MSSYNQRDLKPVTLKIGGLGYARAGRAIGNRVTTLKQTAQKTAHEDTVQKQQFDKQLRHGRESYLLIYEGFL